jgi:hypothetical protein
MLTAEREPQPPSVENREQRPTQSHWQIWRGGWHRVFVLSEETDRRIGAHSQTFPCSIRPAICTPRPGGM